MKQHFSKLLFFLLLFAGKTSFAQSGAGCDSAIVFSPPNDTLLNQSTADSVIWYKFVATEVATTFMIDNDMSASLKIGSGKIIGGTCAAQTTTVTFSYNPVFATVAVSADYLVIGQTYFLKLYPEGGIFCKTCSPFTSEFKITSYPSIEGFCCVLYCTS